MMEKNNNKEKKIFFCSFPKIIFCSFPKIIFFIHLQNLSISGMFLVVSQ